MAYLDGDLFRLHQIVMQGYGSPDDVGDVDQLPGARAIGDQIEKVVDEVRGPERLLLHFLQQAVFRIVRSCLGEQELRVRRNTGEGRVDLVRDAGREETEG